MKIRNGFVSNSSSSSFVIAKGFLSQYQIDKIYHHADNLEENENLSPDKDDAWDITEDEYLIKGYTSMDNFDMREYLLSIGIKENQFNFSSY
jgi:hypothetical protein